MSEVVQALLQTPLGSVLSSAEAADLAQAAKQRTVGRGQYLFRLGDKGDALYVILNGGLDVILGQPAAGTVVVATLGPGQIVGELELMTGALRVASLLATEETSLLEIPSASFEAMLNANRPAATKLVTTIAKALARRLAAVNQRIVAKTAPPPPVNADADTSVEPVAIEDHDLVVGIEDEDLDVLDKLWA